jgi:hypothetical protein
MMEAAPAHRGRRDNGLGSDDFQAVADVDPRLASHLLDVLGLRNVPAYVEPAPARVPVIADRLYVATGQAEQAREVIAELALELGIDVARDGRREPVDPSDDAIDSAFRSIVAGLGDLARPLIDVSPANPLQGLEGKDDSDKGIDHFDPPPAPPVPRLSVATATAAFVTLLGIAILAFGSVLGLSADFGLPLGVALVVFGTGLLIMRLRPEPRDSSADDGAIV